MLRAIQPYTPEDVLRRTVRGQYGAGQHRRQARARLSRRSERRPAFDHRDLRRAQAVRRQLALGGRAVLSAHRQAPAEARDEIAIQFKRPPFMLFRDTPVEQLDPNGWCCTSSRTKASRSASAQRSRARRCGWATSTCSSITATISASEPSTGYERLLYDCMTGRRDALPAWRHGGGRLDGGRADPRRVEGAAAARLPELPAGSWGPKDGGGADGAERPAMVKRRHRSARSHDSR